MIVTLCGSMRFAGEFDRLNAELTLAGHVVLAPAPLPASTVLSEVDQQRLGEVHLAKVALADEVLVVNVSGYVGESTHREIAFARSRGVRVRYLEPEDPGPNRPTGDLR